MKSHGMKLNLRNSLAAALLTVVASGCFGPSGANKSTIAPINNQQPGGRPNIVFVLTDDQPVGMDAATPWIAQNIRDMGTQFDNSFVTTSLCCPARTTLLTGEYAHNHGVISNAGPLGGASYFRANGGDQHTVATELQNAGYQTALIGKYLNQYPNETGDPDTYMPPGWSEWRAAVDVFPFDTAGEQFNYHMIENGTRVAYGSTPQDYFSDVVRDHSLRFVKNALENGRPFFLYMAFVSPHVPSRAAPRHVNTFRSLLMPMSESFNEADVSDKPRWVQRRALMTPTEISSMQDTYRNMHSSLLAVDEAVQALHQFLSRARAIENTVFVFTSDNGYHFGEHRVFDDKNTAFEEAIRVPLYIAGRNVRRGEKRAEIALNLDITPTILDLAGIPMPASVDGRSLRPLFDQTTPEPAAWRKRFLVEHYAPDPVQGSRLSPFPYLLEYSAVHAVDSIYVEYAYGDTEHYRLDLDPAQVTNTESALSPLERAALHAQLAALRTCVGATCRIAED
jgi:arylsulfatase A-like enzyme